MIKLIEGDGWRLVRQAHLELMREYREPIPEPGGPGVYLERTAA